MNKKVSKHVGTSKIRYFVEHRTATTLPSSDKKDLVDSLRGMIGLVSAATGILVALIYLAGRSYANGYFEALNIPPYQVSFSIWEYGEVAWLPMLLYPIGVMIVGGLFWGIIYGIWDVFIVPLGKKVMDCIQKTIWKEQSTWRFPEIGSRAKAAFAMTGFGVGFLCFVLFIAITLQMVREAGRFAGTIAVLQISPQVELVSAVPLPIEKVSITTNSIAGLGSVNSFYVYSGFHLLTYNDGKYYLFREVDRNTCKPVRVFVIEAHQDKQINLSSPISLNDQCQTKLNLFGFPILTVGSAP